MSKLPRGVEVLKSGSVRINFIYNKKRCRETLYPEATKKNIDRAADRRQQIVEKIENDVFNYRKEFPNSQQFAHLIEETVNSLFDKFFEHRRRVISDSTNYTQRRQLQKNFFPRFGNKKINTITVNDIQSWVDDLASNGVNTVTVRSYLSPVKEFFKFVQGIPEVGLIYNPCQNVVLPKNKQAKQFVNPFEHHEIETLFAAIGPSADWKGRNQEQFENFFILALNTGMRPGEQIALEWSDVNFDKRDNFPHGSVMVTKTVSMRKIAPPKTVAGIREIRLTKEARAALFSQREITGFQKTFVYLSPNNTHYTNINSFSRTWLRLWSKAQCHDVPYREMYQLRHTFASRLILGKQEPMWVAQQMGHAGVKTLYANYAKLFKSLQVELGAKADSILDQYAIR